jgi:hypothetical protein
MITRLLVPYRSTSVIPPLRRDKKNINRKERKGTQKGKTLKLVLLIL